MNIHDPIAHQSGAFEIAGKQGARLDLGSPCA